MEIDFEDILPLILWATLSLGVYFVIYRKYITSVFDPVFTYVYTTAFSSLLIAFVVEPRYLIHYFGCQICLFAGFWLVQHYQQPDEPQQQAFNFKGLEQLTMTVYVLLIIYFLSNAYVLIERGSAFFSNDPYARETNFESGFGVFRRINWGVGSFLCAGVTILYLTKPKRVFFYLLLVLTLLTALEGTKSSLLRIVIIVASLLYHPFFAGQKAVVNRLKRLAPIGGAAVIGVALLILSKESSDGILISLIRRLIYGADVVMYFYRPQNEYLLTTYSPLDFLGYIINPITGFLHLSPYVEPFGSVMVSNTRSELFKTDVYLAPNTPFYIEGQIFFGYYGAFFYSLVIGGLFSFIRRIYFTMIQGSYFTLALACTFLFHSVNLVVETNFFITTCFNTCLFVIPVYVIVNFILYGSLTIRKLKFKKNQHGAIA